MIGLLAASQTPEGESGTGGLRDALLPSLPRLATRTATPETAVSVVQELVDLQAQQPAVKDRLVEVIYEPGVYRNTGLGQGMMLCRSSTGNPEDVIFETDVTTGGVLHWFGQPTWLRGLTLRSLPSTDAGPGAKYPLHMTGGGLLTVIDCNLEARNPDSDGGPAILGMDGGDDLDVSFVGCHLSTLTTGFPSNLHGGGVGPYGQRITFYECTMDNPEPIGFAGDPDERTDMYFIGGNVTPGSVSGDVHTHTSGWPAPVGGFTVKQRVDYGIS